MQPFASTSARSSSALVPWGASDPKYSDLTEVVEPTKELNPYLVWMTGKLPTSDRQVPVGWHVHKGVNPHLDELLAHLGYQHHFIEHQNEQSGETELVEYWSLNYRQDQARGAYVLVPVSLVVVARGVPDKKEMKDPQNRHGVAYGWEVNRLKDGSEVLKDNGEPKKTARLKFRAYIHELLPAPDQPWEEANGFLQWFQASLSGYVVDDMLGALYSTYRARRAYNSRLVAQDEAAKTPYWRLSNPTVPASAPRRATSKDGQSTSIIPMRSLIPANETEISEEFLLQHQIPPALERVLLEKDIVLDTWNWSIEETSYLEGLKPRPTGGQSSSAVVPIPGVIVREERPAAPSSVPVAPPPAPEPDPFVAQEQLQVLSLLCGQDQQAILALCQQYGVSDPKHLRVSQFRDAIGRLTSRPQ